MGRRRLTTLTSALQTLPSRLPATPSTSTDRIRGRRGMAIRADFLSRFPLCRHCDERGRVALAVVVDHVVPLALGGSDTEANKQGLCESCNKVKTAQDQAAIAAARVGGGV